MCLCLKQLPHTSLSPCRPQVLTNGLESQQSCKRAMITFVSTINVSVPGGGGGRYRAISNQWAEGDLTQQSCVSVINGTLAFSACSSP